MRIALLLLALVACEKRDKVKPKPELSGTFTLDGAPLALEQCRVGRGVGHYVEVITPKGKLRFEDKKLSFTPAADLAPEDLLECDKLDRSWGAGTRKDGTAYFRGHLIFTCKGRHGALAGDITLDCGQITADERQQLDDNRQKMLDQQKQGSSKT